MAEPRKEATLKAGKRDEEEVRLRAGLHWAGRGSRAGLGGRSRLMGVVLEGVAEASREELGAASVTS